MSQTSPEAEIVLRLLQASSCFRGEVCASLPCACAETLASLPAGHAQTPRMERMEAALRFYADPLRYQGPNQHPLPDDPYAKPDAAYIMDVTRDNGRIAKAALSDTSTTQNSEG